MFSAICNPDNVAFQMTPLEYLDQWDRAPRLMSVLTIVQARVRERLSEKNGKEK